MLVGSRDEESLSNVFVSIGRMLMSLVGERVRLVYHTVGGN
jgi:hypothetical protein